MRVRDRVLINRKVREFVKDMPKGYGKQKNKVLIINEILQANEYFLTVREPDQIIREEVEAQFDTYTR